jgi:hypothetical protein
VANVVRGSTARRTLHDEVLDRVGTETECDHGTDGLEKAEILRLLPCGGHQAEQRQREHDREPDKLQPRFWLRAWLTDKTQVLYFSSRFLILKNQMGVAVLFILLL